MPTPKFACQLLCLFAGGLTGLHAQDSVPASGLHVNGFGSVAVLSQASDFGGKFRRDTSQPYMGDATGVSRDSRIGLQLNYAVTQQLELVAQGVLKDRVVSNSAKDTLEWAFVSYSPTPDLKLRLGRTNVDLFLLSDYRNVGFAYLTARPNVDFYGLLPMDGLDGVDLTRSWEFKDANWRAKAFAGKSQYRVRNSFGSASIGNMNQVMGAVLSREKDGLLMRGTLAHARVDFNATPMAPLQQGLAGVARLPVASVAAQAQTYQSLLRYQDFPVTYGALGMSYDRDNWVLNAEAMRTRSQALPQGNVKAGYLLLGRRLNDVTVFTGASAVRSMNSSVAMPQWAQALAPMASVLGSSTISNAQILGNSSATLINAVRIDQQTLTFGARWDLRPTVALKVQWDRTWAAPTAAMMWSAGGGRADVVTAALDFLF